MWRGNGANVIRYFPTQAMNFAFKDTFQHYFNTGEKNLTKGKRFLNNLLSGGFAGCLTTMFVYPLDLSRTRLGVDIGKSKE